MSLLNPWALLLLAGVPILVLLYFLKLKRPRVTVASALLWQKVLEDLRVNSPFQKLRRTLLLLLQLAALLLLIFALARPFFRAREHRNESLIVLLDQSASMQAREPDGRTRLETARDEVLRLAGNLAREDEMMVIAFAGRARVVCGFTANRRTLEEAVHGVLPTDGPTSVAPALMLARSIVNSRPHPRVLLFSDGGFEPAVGLDLPVAVEFRRVGTSLPNVGMTGLDVRRSFQNVNAIEMFVGLENFSDQPFAGTMNVRLNDRPLDSKFVEVGPRQTLSQVFDAVMPEGGVLEVAYDVQDALPSDNRAWKIVRSPVRHHVLLVTSNAFFMERALRASADIDCTVVAPEAYPPAGTGAFPFATVIWSGVPRPGVGPANNLYFGCSPEDLGMSVAGSVRAPDVLDWDTTHPLNRFIDYANLNVSSAMILRPPDQAATLLRSSQTPLIVFTEGATGGAGVIGFDPLNSNWPLLTSFPLFLRNCIEYFDERTARRRAENLLVERPIAVTTEGDAPRIVLPSGEDRAMVPAPAGGFTFAETEQCGVYRIRVGEADVRPVAVNLFDRRESTLTVGDVPAMGKVSVQTLQSRREINREYWPHLVWILVLVLMIEWFVYHRRLFA